MSDEKTAETLATEEVVNDGIIDLDKLPEAKEEPSEDEVAAKAAEDEKKATEAKAVEEAETEKKKLSGAARAKLREQRLLNENAELQRKLEEISRAPAAKASESDEKAPKEEDYNGDWFAWQRALTAHEAGKAAREAIKSEFQTKEQSEAAKRQTEIVRERQVAHAERVEDAREVIADFDQVMKSMDGVQTRQEVIEEIMSSEKSALLAYHLAKNPDKLTALNSMSGRELAREMGRLEASVSLPEAKKATTAPAPLTALKGGASPSSPETDLAKWLAVTYPKSK